MFAALSEMLARFRPSSVETTASPVGVFGQPRGGTNFVCAWLHYHPEIFCVSERESDWRRPLRDYWRARSIFKRHGVQSKRIDQVTRVVFNKVQRFTDLWCEGADLPDDTRLIFYFRNPARVHLSREAFRLKHDPDRAVWADTEENLNRVLRNARRIIKLYHHHRLMRPCMLLSHEHLCTRFDEVLPSLYDFLGVDAATRPDPRAFFERSGRDGAPLIERRDNAGAPYLANSRTGRRIRGYGRFNPLRRIDMKNIGDERWKSIPGIRERLEEVDQTLAEYYWRGDFEHNLALKSRSTRSKAIASQ